MKKKILILSFATLLFGVHYSFAKDTNPVKVKCYEAEGAIVYDVRGCVPGSDISFYSQEGGGEMMTQVAVNNSGSARVVWSQKNTPAFVLNVLTKNASGIAGNGMVTFTGDKEFTVNDLTIGNMGGDVTLRWNASVAHPEDYTFEVLKSVNGNDWAVVQSLSAQSAGSLPYAFTEAAQTGVTASYQVRVRNTAKEIYYTSNPLYADGGSGISVYPTVVHSTLNLSLNDTRSSSYRIVNMKGQVVASGALNNNLNTCSVANLPAGNYVVEVSTLGSKTTTKFIKE